MLPSTVMQEREMHNVASIERWVSVVAGAALAAYGLKRRSTQGIVVAALGSALLWRGASGKCPIYKAFGVSTAGRDDDHVSVPYGKGIQVEKSITINTDPQALYVFWRKLENLPRFMSHLEAVTVLDSKRSHWVAKGPARSKVEWDAEIINEIPGELIGWRSIEGSRVDHAGSVHFERTPHGTEVRVVLRYDPPAGILGAAFARLFGEDPAVQIGEDLRQLKQIIETGEIPTTVGQPTGR